MKKECSLVSTESDRIHINISKKTKEFLRKLMLTTLDTEHESCGRFLCYVNSCDDIIELEVDRDNLNLGDVTDDMTICQQNGDYAFTFHTHPIAFYEGEQDNYPNIFSDEDFIGIVQDSYANKGTLSNDNGLLVFETLVTPMGIFFCGADEGILEEWISTEIPLPLNLEDLMRILSFFKITKSFIKNFGIKKIKFPLSQRQTTWLKNSIKKKSFSKVENAYNNEFFNKWFGSYQYKEGTIYEDLVHNFAYLGYTQPEDGYMDMPKDKQIKWFKSSKFASIDWKKDDMLKAYLDDLRELGFQIEFFNWSDSIDFKWKIIK
jgi:hypothetical protein